MACLKDICCIIFINIEKFFCVIGQLAFECDANMAPWIHSQLATNVGKARVTHDIAKIIGIEQPVNIDKYKSLIEGEDIPLCWIAQMDSKFSKWLGKCERLDDQVTGNAIKGMENKLIMTNQGVHLVILINNGNMPFHDDKVPM